MTHLPEKQSRFPVRRFWARCRAVIEFVRNPPTWLVNAVMIPMTIGLYVGFAWFLVELGNLTWLEAWQFIGMMMLAFIIVGCCIAAVIAAIYGLSLLRSLFYIRKLEAAGIRVEMNKVEVASFALMLFIGVTFTAFGIFFSTRGWEIHTCMQSGECRSDPDWYWQAVPLNIMIWFMALLGLGSTIWMYFKSFRPLKMHYQQLQITEQK